MGDFPHNNRGRRQLPYMSRRKLAMEAGGSLDEDAVRLLHSWESVRFPMPTTHKRCRECGGRGLISDPVRVRWPSGTVTIEKAYECVTCNGTGIVRRNKRVSVGERGQRP